MTECEESAMKFLIPILSSSPLAMESSRNMLTGKKPSLLRLNSVGEEQRVQPQRQSPPAKSGVLGFLNQNTPIRKPFCSPDHQIKLSPCVQQNMPETNSKQMWREAREKVTCKGKLYSAATDQRASLKNCVKVDSPSKPATAGLESTSPVSSPCKSVALIPSMMKSLHISVSSDSVNILAGPCLTTVNIEKQNLNSSCQPNTKDASEVKKSDLPVDVNIKMNLQSREQQICDEIIESPSCTGTTKPEKCSRKVASDATEKDSKMKSRNKRACTVKKKNITKLCQSYGKQERYVIKKYSQFSYGKLKIHSSGKKRFGHVFVQHVPLRKIKSKTSSIKASAKERNLCGNNNKVPSSCDKQSSYADNCDGAKGRNCQEKRNLSDEEEEDDFDIVFTAEACGLLPQDSVLCDDDDDGIVFSAHGCGVLQEIGDVFEFQLNFSDCKVLCDENDEESEKVQEANEEWNKGYAKVVVKSSRRSKVS